MHVMMSYAFSSSATRLSLPSPLTPSCSPSKEHHPTWFHTQVRCIVPCVLAVDEIDFLRKLMRWNYTFRLSNYKLRLLVPGDHILWKFCYGRYIIRDTIIVYGDCRVFHR